MTFPFDNDDLVQQHVHMSHAVHIVTAHVTCNHHLTIAVRVSHWIPSINNATLLTTLCYQ